MEEGAIILYYCGILLASVWLRTYTMVYYIERKREREGQGRVTKHLTSHIRTSRKSRRSENCNLGKHAKGLPLELTTCSGDMHAPRNAMQLQRLDYWKSRLAGMLLASMNGRSAMIEQDNVKRVHTDRYMLYMQLCITRLEPVWQQCYSKLWFLHYYIFYSCHDNTTVLTSLKDITVFWETLFGYNNCNTEFYRNKETSFNYVTMWISCLFNTYKSLCGWLKFIYNK